jgi:benzoate-CoA ligase family protein
MQLAKAEGARLNATAVLDRNVDEGRGEKPAIVAGDRTLTYRELLREVNRAGHLFRELGVAPEHRVLLVLDDSSAFPVAFLGAMRIGAVPVPVSPLDKASNFAHFLHDSYADVVVADAQRVPVLLGAFEDRQPTLLSVGGEADGALELGLALDGQDDELSPADTHRDDVAFWLYSSGSTGLPKGVVHLHHDIGVTCENFAGRVLGIREEDVHFSTTKLYHAYGLGNGLTFPLHFGATSVLLQGPPKPEPILATLRDHRPTVFFSVPALYSAIVRAPDGDDAFSSVRMCVSAAEALPPVVFDAWHERFGLEIVDGIGSTEMLHIYCSNRPGEIVRSSTGWPVPGYELRLVDDDGNVLEGQNVGNLEVRGDSCAALYWHQHEKTKRSMRGDWFFTGDRFRRTPEGNYVYEGRADDMLKVGGLWVSPIEMENQLAAHELVQAVGVVGITQGDASRIAAFVIRDREGPSDEELAEALRVWCKERMRRYEYPHVVHFVDDLPRTVNGKVQRFQLRELIDDLER